MSRKKINVVYRNRENPQAIRYLNDLLESIFASYAQIDCCYADELTENEKVEADVFLVIDRRLLPKLRRHAAVFQNIVLMSRTLKRENVQEILAIPQGADVLVVDDLYDDALDMVYMIYEMGIGHLNLIAFDPEKNADTAALRHIQYAITPNEPGLVPAHIREIINTGYQDIGVESMVQVMNALRLEEEEIHYRLIQYISRIVEPQQDFHVSYFESYLKSKMLNEYVYDSPSATFLVGPEDEIVYANRRAGEVLGFSGHGREKLEDCRNPELLHMLEESGQEKLSQQVVNIDERNYMLDKSVLYAEKRGVGYFVTLQDEGRIKDMEKSLNKKLIEKGHFAKHSFHDIVRRSAVMEETIAMAKKAAMTEYAILICGESGTGKELFAQAIHNYSARRDKPFIGVNCAAISESLLESALFGYEEGAFTGASKKGKLGYFEQASKGTIFLDEIGDISPSLQAKLLRVLQEKQIMRVGGVNVIDVDVRIIAATNRDLLAEVEKGNFRQDLYYRLNTIEISVPPLRERREDIPLLVQAFLQGRTRGFSPEEEQLLHAYAWPGNVRELENSVLYLQTLGRLPDALCKGASPDGADVRAEDPARAEQEKPERRPATAAEIRENILRTLAGEYALGHGPGKAVMARALSDAGIRISDVILRSVLHEMQEEGLILVGRGRQGTKITEKGRKKLEYFKNGTNFA